MALPTVTTSAATHISQAGALGNGNITATGGANCDQIGFVWGTTSLGDPGNVAPGSSGYDAHIELTGLSLTVQAFTSTTVAVTPTRLLGPMGLLVLNTTYFYRSFAHNSSGYAYGTELSFTTLASYPGCIGFTGGETGSLNTLTNNLTDGYVQVAAVGVVSLVTAPVYSGNYAFSIAGHSGTSEVAPTITSDGGPGSGLVGANNVTPNCSRVYAFERVYFSKFAFTFTPVIFSIGVPGLTNIVNISILTSGLWEVIINGNRSGVGQSVLTTDINGVSHSMAVGKWYALYLSYVDATGVVEFILDDGVSKFTYRGTTDLGWCPSLVTIQGSTTVGDLYYMDDMIVHSDFYCPGRVISRQGKVATPTYDAWTKTGGTVISDVWDDTPFDPATNANSSTALAAQTMVVSSFSQFENAQHGAAVIGPNDTIVGARVMVIGNTASSSFFSIRRIVGGVLTDFVYGSGNALGVADGGVKGDIFVPLLSDLNSMEGGVVKANDAVLTTIEDIWFLVAYIPNFDPPGPVGGSVYADDQWLGGDEY